MELEFEELDPEILTSRRLEIQEQLEVKIKI